MDFYKRVAIVCERIPYGKVATYGQIALLCGKPRNARQVGYALRTGQAGAQAPAHRIVNHQGELSGAGAFEQPDTQRKNLEAEGIVLEEDQRVNLRKYHWKHTMTDAVSLYELFEQLQI